jgi:hypothetical protein
MKAMATPYRAPKPLTAIIPPDRRRLRAAALVAVGVVSGALLLRGGQLVLEALPKKPKPLTAQVALPQGTLEGPDGPLTFPGGAPLSIVHVWLQGCADCMPAFEAARALEEGGGLQLGARVVNVAYGKADPSWAARYGVRQNLVYDHGGKAVVQPLGISSFTTLVMDAEGHVLHRDRPDKPGYAERLRAAVAARR